MIKNRYDDKLIKGNQLIIDLTPGNYVLRIELSLELKNIVQNNPDLRILEIGSGEGDLTKHILTNNESIKIDCLDVSEEMINSLRHILLKFINRINFINKDALEYLENINIKYDIIVSAWTIHNFTWENKKKIFEIIYSNLSAKGKFMLMDKIYPDKQEERKKLLDLQLNRYRYLESELKKEIVSHENQDILDDYRMDESSALATLEKIGFKNIKILDRVDRDVLLIVEK